jgi:signal transduction histidine kinase
VPHDDQPLLGEAVRAVGRPAARYAQAVLIAAAAVWLTGSLAEALERPYFFAAFPAVVLAALVGGTGPGVACVAAYAAGAAWLFVEPRGTLAIATGPAAYRLVLFTLSALLVAALSGRLRTALRRERALREQAEREVRARSAAERAQRQASARLEGLQALTAALSAARATGDVAAAFFASALSLVGARLGWVCLRRGDGELAVAHGGTALPTQSTPAFEIGPLGDGGPAAEAIRTGRAVWLGSPDALEERYPRTAAARDRWRAAEGARAFVPMQLEGIVAGVLGFSWPEPRDLDHEERAFVESVAELCAQAFARAGLFEAEQAARRRAQDAEEAARRAVALQDQLLGVVGHDLRTPLSAIVLGTNVARQLAVDARQRAALDRTQRSAARMTALIGDLLDLSRARQGLGMTVSRRPLTVAELCLQAISELEQVHPGRTVRLVTRGEQRAQADPSRLLQAVSNLVANALRHGAADGDVTVEAIGDAATATIRVHNRGDPIPPAEVAGIFEPFGRGRGGTPRADSVGLGLFIVAAIARAHGGTISVESCEDAGTTFTLAFPRGLPAGDEAHEAPAEAHAAR